MTHETIIQLRELNRLAKQIHDNKSLDDICRRRLAFCMLELFECLLDSDDGLTEY